jgi:hypothetical protein
VVASVSEVRNVYEDRLMPRHPRCDRRKLLFQRTLVCPPPDKQDN